MAASAFQYASGPMLELRDSLAAHRTQCSWWRPSPCSCCCDSQASIRLETTSRKTQPHVAQSQWIGSETTEHRPFLYIRLYRRLKTRPLVTARQKLKMWRISARQHSETDNSVEEILWNVFIITILLVNFMPTEIIKIAWHLTKLHWLRSHHFIATLTA